MKRCSSFCRLTLGRYFARAVVCGAITGTLGLSGCAAFRPIDGVPARYVPDEVKAPTRSGKKTIDLSLLSQTQPSVYHLDTGDVLAISIEGVMPRREGELPPVNMSFNANYGGFGGGANYSPTPTMPGSYSINPYGGAMNAPVMNGQMPFGYSSIHHRSVHRTAIGIDRIRTGHHRSR